MTRGGQSGRGWLGFLGALIVVGYGIIALRAYFEVKHKYDTMNAFAYEAIQGADRERQTVEDIRYSIFKKAQELSLGIHDSDKIEIAIEANRWRVRLEWDDVVRMPGYSFPRHYVVDQNWTRF